jgi:hypothetical protein
MIAGERKVDITPTEAGILAAAPMVNEARLVRAGDRCTLYFFQIPIELEQTDLANNSLRSSPDDGPVRVALDPVTKVALDVTFARQLLALLQRTLADTQS